MKEQKSTRTKLIAALALTVSLAAIALVAPMVADFELQFPLANAKGQAKADLKGTTIVITGASSGFGAGAARKFAARGANVVLAARRADALATVATECGPNALVVATDVSKADQVKALCDAALARFKHIDVWINCAGVGAFGRFDEIPLADQTRMIDINLSGVINGSHFAVTEFKKQGHGTLINVASMAGKIPIAYYATYTATKFGIVGFDDALRAELKADKQKGIHVCTVNPLPTDTEFWANAANYTGHKINSGRLYEADAVVAAINNLVLNPKDEINIGLTGKLAVQGHNLAPRMVEDNYGAHLRKIQFDQGPTAQPSSGTLYRTVVKSTGKARDEQTLNPLTIFPLSMPAAFPVEAQPTSLRKASTGRANAVQLIDSHDRVIIPPSFASITYAGQGIYLCRKKGEKDFAPYNRDGERLQITIPAGCKLAASPVYPYREAPLKAVKSLPEDILFTVSKDNGPEIPESRFANPYRRYGMISPAGKIVVPIEFLNYGRCGKDFMTFRKDHLEDDPMSQRPGQVQIFDCVKQQFCKRIFSTRDSLTFVSEGAIAFRQANSTNIYLNSHHWGWYDLNKDSVFEEKFADPPEFHNGLAIGKLASKANDKNEHDRFFNRAGQFVAPHVIPKSGFCEGFAVSASVDKPGLLGVVNTKFEFVIPASYESLIRVGKNFFACKSPGSSFFVAISPTGKELFKFPSNVVGFPEVYSDLSKSQDGFIVGLFSTDRTTDTGETARITSVFDQQGKMLLPAENFVALAGNGLAVVTESSGSEDRLDGVVNLKGQFVYPLQPSYFQPTERDRFIETQRNFKFDSDVWTRLNSSMGSRYSMFGRFLKEYNLIGMPQSQVVKLLGPSPLADSCMGYSLISGPCANSCESVVIHFNNGIVDKWGIGRFTDAGNENWYKVNMLHKSDGTASGRFVLKQ